ncbi:MAG: LptE family protein [Nitrospinae bacterium]|nr:LptE family protein [Nitrospinota bacterium]
MQISLIFLPFFIIAGCGYHLVGWDSSLPTHIQSIAIPLFSNKSIEPGIEHELTARVREEFITDGRLKVVEEDRADTILSGEINRYSLIPLSFDSQDNVTEYRVEMEISVKLKDIKDTLLINQMLDSKWDYEVKRELTSTEERRISAIKYASRDFARRLVNIVIGGF